MRRTPYKRTAGNRSRARIAARKKLVRSVVKLLPVALLAVIVVVLAVRGCMNLRDNAIENEDQEPSQIYAGRQETAGYGDVGSDLKDNVAVKEIANMGSGHQGNMGPDDGRVNLVGTDSTPAPTARPLVSPSPLPFPSPEPASNGHELDSEMVIVIDAGHGGYDGGSVVGDVIEKDINLAVAKEIARLLEEHGGITVVQTRASDEHVGLQERSDIANEAKGDYFVSVHCNTYKDDASVRGLECHYNEKSDEGADFARSVTNDLKQYTDMKIRSEKANDLAVTVHTYCPAILIEMGFLTNATDCANLSDADYQKQLAERITKAVLKAAGL